MNVPAHYEKNRGFCKSVRTALPEKNGRSIMHSYPGELLLMNNLKSLILTIVLICAATVGASENSSATDHPRMKAYLPSYRMHQLFNHDLNENTAWYSMHPYAQSPGASYTRDLPPSYAYSRGEKILTNYDEILYFSMDMEGFPAELLSSSQEGDLRYLQRLLQNSDTKLSLCISGSSSEFIPVLRNENMKKHLYKELTRIISDYSISGLDLDWEFPRNELEKEFYLDFLKELRNLCDSQEAKLTIAVSRFRSLIPETYSLPDEIHIMSYDFYGRHSTSESTQEALEYMAARYDIPYEKMLMGIPFYGRIFDGYSPDYWKKAQSYREIVFQNEVLPQDDEADGYYFNGMNTVQKKAEMGIDLGLKGFFVWEIGQDSFGRDSLTAVLDRTVRPE